MYEFRALLDRFWVTRTSKTSAEQWAEIWTSF